MPVGTIVRAGCRAFDLAGALAAARATYENTGVNEASSIRTIHAAVRGRVRYEVPALRRRPELVAQLAHALGREPGVREVRGSPVSATLLVLYDPEHPRSSWETTLAGLLGSSPEALEPEPPSGKRLPNPSARAKELLQRATERTVQIWRRGEGEVRVEAVDAVVEARAGARGRNGMESGPASRSGEPPWHTFEANEVLRRVESAPDGLANEAAAARFASDGPNAIPAMPRRSEWRIFVDQLASTPVAMLGVSSLVSASTGAVGDAAAILAVVGINATIGYATESGAERTIAALTQTPHQNVPVLRDGVETEVDTEEVVRGDLLLLQQGVFLAADGRVIEAYDLTVDESSLTGESIPVAKIPAALSEAGTPLADRTNMVYRGTLVTGGSGRALVVATGVRTEIGHIQELAGHVEQRDTPMQRQLEQLGKQLAFGAGAACLGMMGIGLLRGQQLLPLIRTAVSLGVAAVPEGLPTVAMTTLALGLSRMRDERVLVRQLAAVETLGATQVLCLDKTGTLTVNRMTVVAAQAGLRGYEVRQGRFADNGETVAMNGEIEALLRVAVLCNEVQLEQEGAVTVLRGSATESALVQVALDAGVDVLALRRSAPVRSVQRRAQARNYMSTAHEHDCARPFMLKGRPSEVLALCTHALCEGESRPLGEGERAQIELENERMAGRALRVLGFALCEDAGALAREELPRELVWAGLIGMEDPPRDGVRDVLARFRHAGVKTIMITGDQSATAHAVARQIGLGESDRIEIIDSTRLDAIAPELLGSLAPRADVFSRVSPAHKLHIVRALQRAGFVVAMTGDGVNDGPALRAADIGIAMGAGGSVAARELADVVLEEDNLATLIFALEQGRTIYDDIRKAVHFILATNSSELLFTIISVATGVGEPLTPIQLLWINLLTDIFPELALATQPPEADILSRPPRDPHRPMFTKDDMLRIGIEGAAITAGAFGAYMTSVRRGGVGPRARSVAFTTLMFAQLLHAFSVRSETHGIFEREPIATNRWLPIATGGTALVQLVMSLVPSLQRLLGVVPLTVGEWGTVALGSVGPFLFNEASKRFRRPVQVVHAAPHLTVVAPSASE